MDLSRSRQRLLRRISTKRGREAEQVVLLEGPRVISAALAHGAEPLFAVRSDEGGITATSPRMSTGPGEEVLDDALARAGAEVVRVPPEVFESLAATETPQGILAVAREPRSHLPSIPIDPPHQRSLVLDRVQDPGNVGTLIRAAAAFGVDRVLLLDGTADPWGAKALRASAGLAFALPLHRVSWGEAGDWIARVRLPLLVADGTGRDVRAWAGWSHSGDEEPSRLERNPRPPSPGDELHEGSGPGWFLVLGNEGSGVRFEIRAVADDLIAIPVSAGVESLNVAIAGSILLWTLGPARESANEVGDSPAADQPAPGTGGATAAQNPSNLEISS